VGQLRKDNASGDEDERGDGSWPGIALFTNRSVVGGRGRKMISFGVILGMSSHSIPFPFLPAILVSAFEQVRSNQGMTFLT